MTLAGNTEQIFRIIQSIPSKKQNHLKYGSRASDTNEYRRLTTQKKRLIGRENSGKKWAGVKNGFNNE